MLEVNDFFIGEVSVSFSGHHLLYKVSYETLNLIATLI